MSQQRPHDQPQVRTPNDLTRQYVDPHCVVKSHLIGDTKQSKPGRLKESVNDLGVLIPVLARKEDGELAVFDGWERVLNARDAETDVPIWIPEDGHWTDEKARRARLFANTSANKNQIDWLRRAWLLEDAWEELGDTVGLSPSGIADLVNIPESTARHWIEPVRGTWNGTIIDRDSYENGQIRESDGNDNYIIDGRDIEDVIANLGTQKLIEIRTRCEFDDDIRRLLPKFVNDEIDPDEFEQAKSLADEDEISLLEAVEDVQNNRDQQVNTTVVGEPASQVSTVAAEMNMDESEFVEKAIEQRMEQVDVPTEIQSDEQDSGHLRQQSYLDAQVDGPRPEPRLRMESNTKIEEKPDESVHLTVTSPPYNVGWDYGRDQMDNRKYYAEYLDGLIADTFREVYRLTTPGGYCCIVVPHIYDVTDEAVETRKGTPLAADIGKVLTGEWNPTDSSACAQKNKEYNWKIHTIVTWYKGYHEAGLRNQNWLPGDERLLEPELKPNNFVEAVIVLKKPGDREVSDQRKQQSGIVWNNTVEDRDLRENLWRISPDVWEPQYTEESDTAQFPEELAKRCILHWSYVGDTVLDPFCGRGTTLKMAKKLYRESIGYEIQEELERDIREYVGMD